METEVVTEAVTEAVTELPAVTEAVTNAIDVFMYDVSQYNNNSAGFFDSVAKYANNIIHSIKSFESYFIWIRVGIESLFDTDYIPEIFGTMASIAMVVLLIDFIRRR